MKEQSNQDWSDDPRITAYALGEMDEAERAAFEEEIRGDEAAAALVEELRGLGRELEEEFASEQAPGLTELQRQQIEANLGSGSKRGRTFYLVRVWSAVAATLLVVGFGVTWILQENARSVARHDSIGLDLSGGTRRSYAPAEGTVAPSSESMKRLQGLGYTSGENGGTESYLGDDAYQEFSATVAHSRYLPRLELERGQPLYDFKGERVVPRPVTRYPEADEGNREQYAPIFENRYFLAATTPLSTFSIDVDTASYANVRRFLEGGTLPPPDAVRIEELINYFPYDYANPDGDTPFSVDHEVGACPWAPQHRLVRIGLKGRSTHPLERRPSNLVFLVDVSGSMDSPDKLPLLKRALHMLVQQLDERDLITIVVYASAEGVALSPTRCSLGVDVHNALERLSAGGSTNGGAGIELAYRYAAENFIEGGINRVLLATDGDFNVGVTSDGALVRMIEEKAKTGVFLSVLGFGTGNLQDAKMEQLADQGNGNYAYIDSVLEARKVLVEQLGGTLETIAKDVKIQVEFNPVEVKGYRLIGYENRVLAAQDFNDDTKDAGEIGAGHTVTALYEVVPAGGELEVPGIDPLKYQVVTQPSGEAFSGELLNLKLRYKEPEGDTSKLLVFPVTDGGQSFEQLSVDTRWAASVAAFGLVLRDSRFRGTTDLAAVSRWALECVGEDPGGYRAQFIGLVGKARQLQ